MKTIKTLNTIALLIPFIVAAGWFFNEDFIILAIVSTMATGFIQVCLGIFLLIKFPKNIPVIIYLSLVLLYFTLLYFNIEKAVCGEIILFGMPPILCLYLSIIIYTKK
jgi:hypothetical protein